MRLCGYPASAITILATYNGQKMLSGRAGRAVRQPPLLWLARAGDDGGQLPGAAERLRAPVAGKREREGGQGRFTFYIYAKMCLTP